MCPLQSYNTATGNSESGIKLTNAKRNIIEFNYLFDNSIGIHVTANNNTQNKILWNNLLNNTVFDAQDDSN
ncbi:MAG: NosD domain-containing protein [Candidatus Hodarchaeales archaeon]